MFGTEFCQKIRVNDLDVDQCNEKIKMNANEKLIENPNFQVKIGFLNRKIVKYEE